MSAHAIRRSLGVHTQHRRVAGQVAAGLLIAAIAAGLTRYADTRSSFLGLAAVLVVVGTLWFATTSNTQLALALFMVYIGLLDGYLKLATGFGAMTFLRDLLLFALVLGILVRAYGQGTRLPAPPLTAWVLGFVVLVLVQIFNPHGGTLTHSLAGVRQHLEFVPLFFLTFAFVRTTKALRVFVVLLLLIAAANGIAGWIQFHLTPQQFAAWGPGYAERILGLGQFSESGRSFYDLAGNNFTRPFGLGSESGSGGIVGAFAIAGVLAFASLFTRPRYIAFAIVMAVGAVTAVVTSQGRGAVISCVVIVLAYALLTMTSRRGIAGLVGIAIAAAVALFVVQGIVGKTGSSGLRYEGLSASSIVKTTDEARGKSIANIPRNMVDYPLGAGLAVAGPASGAPGGTDLVGGVDAESEFSFLTLETGVPGAVLITVFTVMLLALGIRRCRHEPDREARVLLAAIIAPIAGMLALYLPSAITNTTPGGPYLWAVGGVVAYWLVARPAELRRAAAATGEALPNGS